MGNLTSSSEGQSKFFREGQDRAKIEVRNFQGGLRGGEVSGQRGASPSKKYLREGQGWSVLDKG